jgi:hypothetical protein
MTGYWSMVPAVGMWSAVSIALFGGGLTFIFDDPGSRSVLAITLLTCLGVAGGLIIFWMAASAVNVG